MANILLYSCFILLCNNVFPTEGAIKQWIPNTNYDNPKNWNTGRLPCASDTISFVENSPPVFIQQNITMVSMELPMNGEIILGNGAFIAAANPSSSSAGSGSSNGQATCKGQKVKFVRTEPLEWLDPDNWHEGEIITDQQPARLDTERVPCIYDDTIFPSKSSFLVSLDSDVSVKSLQISGITYSSYTFTQFLASKKGKKQLKFSNGAEVSIEAQPCEDITGCACGNDKGMILHKICELKKSKCPKVNCDTPIIPKGHCCSICGVVLTMDYGFGFKINFLQDKIQQNFLEGESKVYTILSKSSNDRIQLVVLDTENNGDTSKRTGNDIKKYIQKDIDGPKKLGLTYLSVQNSGRSQSPRTDASKSRPFFHNTGSIVGVVISAIVLLLIIALVMYCLVDRNQCRNRLTLANPFRRFSGASESGKGDLEMDDSISYMDVLQASGELNTFDNPMYNIPTTSTPSVQDLAKHKQAEALNNNSPATLDPSSVTFVKSNDSNDGTTSFANPLFGSSRTANTNISFADPHLRLNPVYSEDGIEEDSQI